MCVLAAIKRMDENCILELWRINEANTIERKHRFICSTYGETEVLKCFTSIASKISPSIFPRKGNREQSNVDRFACNLVTQEKLPDIFGLLI